MLKGYCFAVLLLLRVVAGVVTTSTVTLTNGVGVVITQLTVFDPATQTGTTRTGTATGTLTGTATTGTGTATTGTGTATTGTGTATTGTGTTTTGTGTTTTGTGTGTGTGTTTTGTTTPGVAATTTSSSASSVLSSGSGASTSSSSRTSSGVATPRQDGTRPDPSTDFTAPPDEAVTTLSIDSFVTITEGTTRTYTSSRGRTSDMWVTVVRGGHTVVVQTTFAQRFTSQYAVEARPSSGSIGLGTISGTIGQVRSDMRETVRYGNAPRIFSIGLLPLASTFAFLIYLF
ncbi:hypothetical protein HG535_0F01890 [Zygotorulaspora mrakii]|uniref:Protein KRE1 n=1 Tax=Zygotorulaspora mrakii TaxID=42260 RepID=A0A7H9B4R2_ZYGMR|nr:uncharacterized protein HG535_0F01890 [Zygotorulaspora mrakii]QLG73678.1 hypothetical protein HG535_0F01890 [Zygotorulaspora mrakii]